jgi:aminoglycoside phosphotransferase (APT) family kinase protein
MTDTPTSRWLSPRAVTYLAEAGFDDWLVTADSRVDKLITKWKIENATPVAEAGRSAVIRGTHEGRTIALKVEPIVAMAAAIVDLSDQWPRFMPPVREYDLTEGAYLCDWVDGTLAADMTDSGASLVPHLAAHLPATPSPAVTAKYSDQAKNWIYVISRTEQAAQRAQRLPNPPVPVDTIKARAATVLTLKAKLSGHMQLCHGDLVPGNIVTTHHPGTTLYLLDANPFYGDIAGDLAMFTVRSAQTSKILTQNLETAADTLRRPVTHLFAWAKLHAATYATYLETFNHNVPEPIAALNR